MNVGTDGKPIHSGSIFFASFLTLVAAGIGFAVRGAILGDWAAQYSFTKYELGTITGGGLAGFGITIILCSFIADKVGYRALLIVAFLLHFFSCVVTLAATPVYGMYGRDATFQCLFWSALMMSLGNGVTEAAINPLVATLYPKEKTHYLNILHAGWPGGLIIGGLLGFCFVGDEAAVTKLRWEYLMAVFFIPTLIYGFIVFKEKFPVSEAVEAGLGLGTMALQLFSPLLLFLFLIHAMIGYVELGTDGWITNIMSNVLGKYASLLFIYTSGLMFVLRFFAGPIVHKINPLGLLLASAVLAACGLFAMGSTSVGALILIAATIYGLGKTFFWPTMLGVIGERYPKGGALVMGISGGIGMLSAGILGGPMIGYKQDYFATQYLKEKSAATYDRYTTGVAKPPVLSFFPPIAGLDGQKVSVLLDLSGEADLKKSVEILRAEKAKNKADAKPESKLDKKVDDIADQVEVLNKWWDGAKASKEADKPVVGEANTFGGQMALKYTAGIPATMAVCYLLLVGYFAARGGYKQIHLERDGKEVEEPIT